MNLNGQSANVTNAVLVIGHLNLSLLTIDGLDCFSFADIGDLTAGIEIGCDIADMR